MNKFRRCVYLTASCLVTGGLLGLVFGFVQANEAKQVLVPVTRIIDGDTIEVEISGQKEKVRLLGIDTPELSRSGKPAECFAKKATDRLKALMDGSEVYLLADRSQGDRDRFDRLLRYVYLPGGTNVNLDMIRDGYAHEYTYSLPYQYQAEFLEAEKTAREKERGLWGTTCAEDLERGRSSFISWLIDVFLKILKW